MATLRFIARHPLARQHRARALLRWAQWQACKRLLPGAVAVSFVNDTRLLMAPGMTGATGNFYCGLHEFEDMAFVLHALGPGDLLVDVGANVGSYTLLALAAGAHARSYEPDPLAFARLSDNIHLNRFADRATLRNTAVGATPGTVAMTTGRDTMNQVVADAQGRQGATALAEQVCLDDEVALPGGLCVLKIDVEGYEARVLAGADRLLAADQLQALVLELNGSGRAFGSDDETLHAHVLARGFTPCRYVPFERKLHGLHGRRSGQGNTLYVRDLAAMQARLAAAPRYRVAEVDL